MLQTVLKQTNKATFAEQKQTKKRTMEKIIIITGGAQGIGRCIDEGMTRQMIYHGDHGWKLEL